MGSFSSKWSTDEAQDDIQEVLIDLVQEAADRAFGANAAEIDPAERDPANDQLSYLALKRTAEKTVRRELSNEEKERLTELVRQQWFRKYHADKNAGGGAAGGATSTPAAPATVRLDFEVTKEVLSDPANPLAARFASWSAS